MKIILKEEVDNLGLAGDIVDVADGYGRNFLIPRGKAILATPGAMKEAEALLRSRKVREAATLDDAKAAKEVLESRTLKIAARVDERGHLYGSVTAADVHRVLRERGHDIERKRIDLRGSIKEIGTYEVPVQVHPQVSALIEVEVVDEEGKVTVLGGEVEPDVDTEAIEAAAAEAAGDSTTDVDVLAEQALQAAKQYEKERLAAEAEQAEAGEDVAASDDVELPEGTSEDEVDAAVAPAGDA